MACGDWRKNSECLWRSHSNLSHWLPNNFAYLGLTEAEGRPPSLTVRCSVRCVDYVFWWLPDTESSSRSYERNRLWLVSQRDPARSLTAGGVIPHINHLHVAILNAHAFLERQPSSITEDQIKRMAPLQFGDETRWQHRVTECWGKVSVITGWQRLVPK